MINWQEIDTVLLDMDGTLLDLHFDSYFWLEHLPKRYAEIHGRHAEEIREALIDRIMSERGTLNWYCLDYWSDQLEVPIVALKREMAHLIRYRPQALEFLKALRAAGKRTVLATNAHRGSLDLKIEMTSVDREVDRVICAHDFGVPKEDQAFWQQLQAAEPFDPARTLFIDDSLSVLRAAREYGIGSLLTIAQPDMQVPPREPCEFSTIEYFSEVMPTYGSAE